MVPTRTIEAGVQAMVRELGYGPAALGRVDKGFARQPEFLRKAAGAGLTILAGTDAGMGPTGMVRGEAQLLIEAGLAPETALGGPHGPSVRGSVCPGSKKVPPPTSWPTARIPLKTMQYLSTRRS